MAKKLKIEDIPEGYNYAAVDADGFAYAFKDRPIVCDDKHDVPPFNFGHHRYIGKGFDFQDWQNSLVCRETSERPRFKNKLNWAHIPQDLNWAAVDKDGSAWAFKQKPTINKQDGTWFTYTPEYLFQIGEGFDSSDWQNSLVTRENIKTEPAYKETTNKLSYSEIDPYFLEQMARRMNEGKRKYGPNNWKKLSEINELLDAAQRHLLELRKMMEEDFEPIPGQETDLQHCAALACNAMFIHYHLNPNT